MFDQIKAMGAIAGLLRDRDRLKTAMETLKQRLDEARVSGACGAAQVEATGRGRVLQVRIDEQALASGDAAALGEDVARAVNLALEAAQRLMREEAERSAAELGLPAGEELARMLGGGGL